MRVRIADPGLDARRVAEIYRPFVEDTTISFEENSPTPAAMGDRMRNVLDWTPWLVAVNDDDQVVGYAYASRHRERAGYRWSVDLTAYVDAGLRRHGIGRMLYRELLPILRRQRFLNVYAGIGLPNAASVGLHETIGMTRIGVYEKVGWKLGQWVDVAWYGMHLTPVVDRGAAPAEPIAFPDLSPGYVSAVTR